MSRLLLRLVLAALLAPLLAQPLLAAEDIFEHEYSRDYRPEIVFPRNGGGQVHVSPFPMGKRAATVRLSDACFRDCNNRCAWRYAPCHGALGNDRCVPQLDACARACQTECRIRGGPAIPGAAD